MGVVYEAFDHETEAKIALKTLRKTGALAGELGMKMHAAIAHRELAARLGGSEGAALASSVEKTLEGEVVCPGKFANVLMPGFS